MAILDYEYVPNSYPASVKRGIDFLYEAADRKPAVDAWVDCFSKSGSVVKNDFQATGPEAIKAFLLKGWENTKWRDHDVKKVTVLQQSPLKVSIEGETYYLRDDGSRQHGKWTAVQTYVEEEGAFKIAKYEISFTML